AAAGPRWQIAALTGLAATGDDTAKKQLLTVLADPRSPRTADAATAVGVVFDPELLQPLVGRVQSRNRQIALNAPTAGPRSVTGARTASRGLAAVDAEEFDARVPGGSIPKDTRTALAAAVAALALDAYVETDVRTEALGVARVLREDGFPKLLAELTD